MDYLENSKGEVFLRSLIIMLCLLIGLVRRADTQTLAETDKPNVILILADDMGIGDISYFNDGMSKTPNIDKLIDQSVYFNKAYAGSPVCAPSRAALLTGRYPHRTGDVTLNQRRYPELTRIKKDEKTIANIFRTNGYETGLVGKWHSGHGAEYHPLKRGFDEFVGFKGWEVSESYFDYRLDIQGTYQTFTNEYLTDNLTRRSIDFVQRHQDGPFFLHLAHYAPHRPLSAPKELIEKYLDRGLDENTAIIYAMIEVMDSGIGELVKELENLGINDNTIIIFSSDNGPDPIPGERYNMNLRGTKYTIYEGGIHVPFLIRWTGTLKSGKRDEIITFTDVLPTLIEICNLKVSPFLKSRWDGGSFASLLFDEEAKGNLPDYRFWQWNRGVPFYSHNAAMREGKWKLVRPFVTRGVPEGSSNKKSVLYNLEKDPQEKNNVAEKYPGRYERMRVLLKQWSRKVEFERLKNERK